MITHKTLCAASLLLTVIIQSSPTSEERYGADFLQALIPTKAAGMGESFAAHSIGVRSLNNNPAGLAHMEGSELLMDVHRMQRIVAVIMREKEDGKWEDYGRYEVEPTETGVISYGLPMGRFGNLGMGLVYSYSGRFIRVDEEGRAVNTFPKDDLAFSLGYSLRISQGVSVGFDIKSVRSKVPIDARSDIGRTYAMNVGFLHQIGSRARVGAVLQNIGNEISFSTPDIPSDLRRRLLAGATYTVKESEDSTLSVSMDVHPPFEHGPRYNLGAELLYAKRVAFRIGYMRGAETYHDPMLVLHDQSAIDEKRVWIRKGPTIGVGLRLGGVEINASSAPRREPELDGAERSRLEQHDPTISFSCAARF